jgi:two-component system NtrC family sensor kinase
LLKDMLRLQGELPPREKLVQLVDSVLKAVDRCGAITHRLLDFTRRMDVTREAINLEELLKEVTSFIDKEASYRGVEVTVQADEDAPQIESDRGQLQQVFLNIINNAIAAIERDGRVDVRIAKAGADGVAVSIRDTGSGIPADVLPHIFDPFYTTKKGSGTGLGLSITRGIVERMGGRIEVDSKEGQGTTFTITLPARQTLGPEDQP